MKRVDKKLSKLTTGTEIRRRDRWEGIINPKYMPWKYRKSSKLPQDVSPDDGNREVDINYTIEKLQEIISDPDMKSDVPRICRLLQDYIRSVWVTGFALRHLSGVITILQFLASEAKEVSDYQIHLDHLLELCCLPPTLEKASDKLTCSDTVQEYFTLLGYFLATLSCKQQILRVHDALHFLILDVNSSDLPTLPNDLCIAGMEKSKLPIMVVELLNASVPPMYQIILELVFVLVSTSDTCCWRMLELGLLNTIMTRIDLPYATQLRCTPPPEEMITGMECSGATTSMIMNILCCLMQSVLPRRNPPKNLLSKLAPARCASWGLRYAFKRHICYGQYRAASAKIRNEIATLFLMGLVHIPSWNLVHCGVASDVINLLSGLEFNSVEVLSQRVKFRNSNIDLEFQKILLLIVAYLAEVAACISLIVKGNSMNVILQLVNPVVEDVNISWHTKRAKTLYEPALHALSSLAPKIPQEFVKCNGIARLIMILDWSVERSFDSKFVSDCLGCICEIVLKADSYLLDKIRQHGLIFSLMKIVNYILEADRWPSTNQQILTLSLITIDTLMQNQRILQEMYEDQCITIAMRLLFKFLYQKDNDFEIHQRLFLAIGAYIWKCIVPCPTSLKKFVDFGAVYVVLDVIEIINYPAQCLYLGLLTDMCDNYFCGVYLCTWRGIDKNKGIWALLARIWREEEIRLRVRTLPDGSVGDVQFPQMGYKQWHDTYVKKLLKEVSPAIIDMIGSTRSKIYAIKKIIERDEDKHKLVMEKYRILQDQLTVEDKVTMASINIYLRLKLGQVWIEVSKYLKQVGITPLGMDSQMMSSIIEHYYSWGLFIKEQQRKILEQENIAEGIKEKDDYDAIQESMLGQALVAFDEIDYILRGMDRSYMLQKKYLERMNIHKYKLLPEEGNAEHCYRTYQDNIHVTAVYGQQFKRLNLSALKSNITQTELRPVSPPDSRLSLSDDNLTPATVSSISLLSQCEEPEVKIKKK